MEERSGEATRFPGKVNSISNSPEGTELLEDEVEPEEFVVAAEEEKELLVDDTVVSEDWLTVVDGVVSVELVLLEGIRYNAEAAATTITTRITTITITIEIPE